MCRVSTLKCSPGWYRHQAYCRSAQPRLQDVSARHVHQQLGELQHIEDQLHDLKAASWPYLLLHDARSRARAGMHTRQLAERYV